MEEKPIDVLIEEYKEAVRRYVNLLETRSAALWARSGRTSAKYLGIEKAKNLVEAEHPRLGVRRELEEVKRLLKNLRCAIAERLAQRSKWDAETERILGDIGEFIIVERYSFNEPQYLGKIPHLEGKAVSDLLRRWFGPGRYGLEHVEGGALQVGRGARTRSGKASPRTETVWVKGLASHLGPPFRRGFVVRVAQLKKLGEARQCEYGHRDCSDWESGPCTEEAFDLIEWDKRRELVERAFGRVLTRNQTEE